MNNEKIRVLFMVDIKKRDLVSYLILKKELEKKNLEIFFCRNGMEIPTVIKHDINIVILTQLITNDWILLAKKLKKLNCYVISLPSEGNPIGSKIKKKYTIGPYKKSYECLDLIFAWTKEMHNLLKKNNCYPNSPKIVWSGYHRLIPMQRKFKKFRKNLISTSSLNLNKNYKIKILFTTNYVDGDYYDYKYEISNIKDDNNTFKGAKRDSINRKKFIDFFNQISKNKNILYILKIHPMEKPDIYLKKLNLSDNVLLSVNDYIEGLIEFSDILIGRSCHTQYEAISLNKPTIELDLKKKNNNLFKKYMSRVKSISDVNEFNKMIKIYMRNKNKITLSKKSKKQILSRFKFNGKLNNEKIIVSEIVKISKKIKYVSKSINIFDYFYYLLKYELLSKLNFFFHDIFYLRNFKKKLLGKYYYIDYRKRIDKHYHSEDVLTLNQLL